MKKLALLTASVWLMLASSTPAMANRAPVWSTPDYFAATLYGSEWDGIIANSGTITDGDVDLDIHQSGSPTIRIINIDVGHTANLTDYTSVTVSADDSDVCDTTGQVVTLSGDEISIKGINCHNNNSDGDTEVNVDVRGLEGTISSDFFTDRKIEGTFRYYTSRKDKTDSYRMANATGLDFESD